MQFFNSAVNVAGSELNFDSIDTLRSPSLPKDMYLILILQMYKYYIRNASLSILSVPIEVASEHDCLQKGAHVSFIDEASGEKLKGIIWSLVGEVATVIILDSRAAMTLDRVGNIETLHTKNLIDTSKKRTPESSLNNDEHSIADSPIVR